MKFKSAHRLLSLTMLTILISSCEDPPLSDPSDPHYELTAPTFLTAEAITDSKIRLSWKNNEQHTQEFLIQRKQGSSAYVEIATVPNEETSFTDTTCSLGVVYSYAILSKFESNLSLQSNILFATTSFDAPSFVEIIPVSDSNIQLSWMDKTTFEDGFIIERESGSGFDQIAILNSNDTSYTDSLVHPGIDYIYRIAAFTEQNVSQWTVSTSAQTSFPQPSNLRITQINDAEIEIEWTDNCSFEVGYRVERDSGSGFEQIVELNVDETHFIDTGLILGTIYSYRVAGFSQSHTSAWITGSPVTTIFPGPTELSVQAISDIEIQLSWVDNCGFEAGFIIERMDSTGFKQIALTEANTVTFTDASVDYGIVYAYRVTAYTPINVADWTSSSNVFTHIPKPSGLTATVISNSEIMLTWVDNCSFEAGYIINRSTESGFSHLSTAGANETESYFSNLSWGATYTFQVMTTTPTNSSEYSTPVSASTDGVQDIDGNTYEVVQIGDQLWMAENLKVTHYRNGDPILSGLAQAEWSQQTTGAFCYYDNDIRNADIYGAMYNGYALSDSRNVAPYGWHVASDAEWMEMINAFGGYEVAGHHLRTTGSQYWNSPNEGATNASGFSALPGGYRGTPNGYFGAEGLSCAFWSTTQQSPSHPTMRFLIDSGSAYVHRNSYSTASGYSVRCIKD